MRVQIITRFVALALLLTPVRGVAQDQPTLVPDALSCQQCRVEFRVVARLAVDDASLTQPPIVATSLGSGGYVLLEFPALVAKFARTGAFEATLSREGQGPGEIYGAGGIVGLPGDSVLILDARSTRALVIGPDGKVARELTLPSRFASPVVLRWPTLVAVTGRVRGAAARSVHLLDFSAGAPVVRASFWEPVDPRAGGGDVSTLPVIAAGSRDDIWTGDPLEYHLAHWSSEGTLRRQLRRQPAWFATRSAAWRGSPTDAPPPLVASVVSRPDGRLMAYVKRAAPNWRAAWASPATGGEVRAGSLSAQHLYEFIVEVLDPEAGRVVARGTAPPGVVYVLPNGQLLQYTESANGEISIHVVEPVLIEP